MQDVLIATRTLDFTALFTTNSTASSIVEPIPVSVARGGSPVTSGSGGIDLSGKDGGLTASAVMLAFFGVGSDTNTFLANAYGWQRMPTSTIGNIDTWVPILLATFTGITLDSTQPFGAQADFAVTNYFATAITLGVGNSGVSVEVVSPGHAAHEIAHVVLDTKGSRHLSILTSTASSATSCNGLYKRM